MKLYWIKQGWKGLYIYIYILFNVTIFFELFLTFNITLVLYYTIKKLQFVKFDTAYKYVWN